MIVFKTTNNVTGMIYVGQTILDDPHYLGSGIKIKKAINKYGRDNFTRETLCECQSQEELNEQEIFWIDRLDAINPEIGYNIHTGGNRYTPCDGTTAEKISKALTGRKLPEDTCKKMSESRSGAGHFTQKPDWDGWSEETLKKMREAKLGKKLNKEHKENMSLSQFKRWESDEELREKFKEEYIGEGNPFYGKTHTEETRKRISEAQKGSRWVVDSDNKCIKIKLNELDDYLSKGYQQGRKWKG